jgi:hypothetical protein
MKKVSLPERQSLPLEMTDQRNHISSYSVQQSRKGQNGTHCFAATTYNCISVEKSMTRKRYIDTTRSVRACAHEDSAAGGVSGALSTAEPAIPACASVSTVAGLTVLGVFARVRQLAAKPLAISSWSGFGRLNSMAPACQSACRAAFSRSDFGAGRRQSRSPGQRASGVIDPKANDLPLVTLATG